MPASAETERREGPPDPLRPAEVAGARGDAVARGWVGGVAERDRRSGEWAPDLGSRGCARGI